MELPVGLPASPRTAPVSVDTPLSTDKANQGRVLLMMSLQELPVLNEEDKTPKNGQENGNGLTEADKQNEHVVPVSVGAILLMLAPLLII